jgi:hypothetical protein
MENNAIYKLLSKFVLEGAEIIAHISYWSGKFHAQTIEDFDKQKYELKEYPLIIHNWNEKVKNILKKYASDSIQANFIHNDEILVALKDIDTNIDSGYYSRQALSDDNEYDPVTEQLSIKSPLTIISGTISDKINTIKSCLDEIKDSNKQPANKKAITILQLLREKNGGLKVYANKDYSKGAPLHSSSKTDSYWNKIIEIAENGNCPSKENFIKYFNLNLNNPIYNTLGYEQTKILEERNGMASPLIEIGIITQEYINRSKGQKNS